MEALSPLSSFALAGALALLLTLLLFRLRQRGARPAEREALDTVAGWPPESARVLTVDERQAFDLLKRAAPAVLVLAQVPLSRFIRVPMRHSYSDWLQRVGSLSADLVICDSGSRVLAVIDIRAVEESARSRRRHERMARVLEAAGLRVYTWREGELPTVQQVRSLLSPLLAPSDQAPAGQAPAAAPRESVPSRAVPLIPVAEIEEILADGDRAAAGQEPNLEPVPSGFFDEFEPVPAAARR
jgi:hypothetical protein